MPQPATPEAEAEAAVALDLPAPPPAPAKATAIAAGEPKGKGLHVIVVVHGIGSQARNATVQSAASCLGTIGPFALAKPPLGFFHGQEEGRAVARILERLPIAGRAHPLDKVAFAEVFWADIPKALAGRKDTLEEIKTWGRSVVERARFEYGLQGNGTVNHSGLEARDFALAAGAVEEIVETIRVSERLLRIAEWAGVFQFDLRKLLDDFVGDVQIVAEFDVYRRQIIGQFHRVLAQLTEEGSDTEGAEIHVVAHSEGTVIAFMGLLYALIGNDLQPEDAKRGKKPADTPGAPLPWLKQVRGFMTIGSPIDKHIALWPRIWTPFEPAPAPLTNGKTPPPGDPAALAVNGKFSAANAMLTPIRWRNYYDHGDPIGFQLDTARTWMREVAGCRAFEFSEHHDYGFSRYWLPGKAHNDYWADSPVFTHFLREVGVLTPGQNCRPPAQGHLGKVGEKLQANATTLRRRWRAWRRGRIAASAGEEPPAFAELNLPPCSFPLQGACCAIVAYVPPLLALWAANFFIFKGVADCIRLPTETWHMIRDTALTALLLLGTVAAARLPRLLKPSRNPLCIPVALLCFAAGCAAYLGVEPRTRFLAGRIFFDWSGPPEQMAPTLGVLAGWALLAVSGFFLPRAPKLSRRFLVFGGFAFVALLVGNIVSDPSYKYLPSWGLVLAGLAFLYLWWLSILLFDLAVLWHRYIRSSRLTLNLHEWWRKQRGLGPKPV